MRPNLSSSITSEPLIHYFPKLKHKFNTSISKNHPIFMLFGYITKKITRNPVCAVYLTHMT
jgi:hypothetical protein